MKENTSHKKEIFQKVEEFWSEEHPPMSREEIEQAWSEDKSHILSAKNGKMKRLWMPMAVAAAVILLVVIVYPLWNSTPTANETQMANLEWITSSAPSNALAQVSLPDKTHVLLSPGASITYEKSFETRKVKLQGTAYFNVTKNPNKPFQIKTGNWTSTVLGTSFNMNFSDSQLKVDLYEGKLQILDSLQQNEKYILTPGNSFASKEKQVKDIFNTNTLQMDFTDTPLIEVLGYLESIHGKRFVLKGDVENIPVTIRIPTKTSLQEVLPTISLITSLKFEEREDEVWVR